MEFGQILMMLLVLFLLARFASGIVERLGFPGLIGEIVVGIIVANLAINGTTLFDVLELDFGNQNNPSYAVLYTFSELGVIFLLFSVGLETRVKDLLGSGKTAMFVAVLGVIVPFVLGFAFIQFNDGNFHHAMFMAAAMVATSVGITARVIKDMHLMDVKESRIIISAAVIDDVLGMIVLAIVKGTAGSSGEMNILSIIGVTLIACIFVIGIILIAKYGIPYLDRCWTNINNKREKPLRAPNALAFAIILCLFFAWLAEEIGLAAIIGSFLAGMLFSSYAEEKHLIEHVESITTLFISFFFVHVGLQVDLGAMSDTAVVIDVIVVLIIALISKYIGCGLGAKISERSLSSDSVKIIGIGMIPRGEVGIIVAAIGLHLIVDGEPALSAELYSVIVVMAVATTIIAPPLLARAFKRKYNGHAYQDYLEE